MRKKTLRQVLRHKRWSKMQFKLLSKYKSRFSVLLYYTMSNILFWWTEDFDAWSTALLNSCTRLWRAVTVKPQQFLSINAALNIKKCKNCGKSETQAWIKIDLMCNYWLLHQEKHMRAWSRGLQNTVPALGSKHHIRQQFINEKRKTGLSSKDCSH